MAPPFFFHPSIIDFCFVVSFSFFFLVLLHFSTLYCGPLLTHASKIAVNVCRSELPLLVLCSEGIVMLAHVFRRDLSCIDFFFFFFTLCEETNQARN